MKPIVYTEHWRMAMQVQLAAICALWRMRRLNPQARIKWVPSGARCHQLVGREWRRVAVDCGGWNLPPEQRGADSP
jgi:hypothetical protein